MIRRAVLLLVLAVFALAAIPFVLVPLYALPTLRPLSTPMLADRLAGQPFAREWVAFEDIAPVLVHSVMMSEDGQFCAHHGVDWGELNAVVEAAVEEGEAGRGASTIPMQTVKNLFLWNDRSFVRKALEIPLALYADGLWSKRRMMEIYLNVAEWGSGVYGIGAAARYYFDRPAGDLTASQAALLAVTLPAPRRRDPADPSRGLARLAGTIEARAEGSGDYVGCLREDAG